MSRHKKFPIRVPRFAAGIRAQETRGGAGWCWWHRRWRDRLESMGLGSRLGRGRNYAAAGQVVELRLQGPHVEAMVQGTRAEPYAVKIDFRTPEGEARARIVAQLREEPMRIARLLVDDLPTDVETIFRRQGCDLFPGGRISRGVYDMATWCSCPDYANPCKHSAAVLLLLGEEIARRPSTLLELRGISLEELYDED